MNMNSIIMNMNSIIMNMNFKLKPTSRTPFKPSHTPI